MLGCFLFENVKFGEIIGDDRNFENFSNSFVLLFGCSTGEDWYIIMFDCIHVKFIIKLKGW